ncbi:hypothetical protein SEPCBS119000_006183 [Sporothrix epigloea]|uniref:Uncharacterized protein n=1 Tax=Sporothrix epigloea TaxID=1892477 RepID=A0ABP0E1M1_9PEZI
MFQTQEEAADYEYPRGPLKRYHEEEAVLEAVDGSTIGFTEHRNKRLQTLPLRTSPNTPRVWSLSNSNSPFEGGQPRLDSTMTPPGSFSETLSQAQRGFQQFDEQQAALRQYQSDYSHQNVIPPNDVGGDMDVDMTMNDTLASTSQMAYGMYNYLASETTQDWQGSAIPDCDSAPTLSNFPAQVCASGDGAALNVMKNGHSCSSTRSLEHPGNLGEWSMNQNRSLPSPISDSGAFYDQLGDEQIEDRGEQVGGPEHSYGSPAAMQSSPLPVAVSSPIRGSLGGTDNDPSASPSPRKGHTRSRHTIVAWTAQPGMKRAFSIGYRADCEKCVNRVPGHFNHIIVS